MGEKVEMEAKDQQYSIELSAFLKKQFPPRELVLAPWLPVQGRVMIYGKRGCGKTWFGSAVAKAISQGGAFLDWTAPIARNVLYVDGEMHPVEMQQRFNSLCAGDNSQTPPSRLRYLSDHLVPNGLPSLADREGQLLIEREAAANSVIFLDNYASLFPVRENEQDTWCGPQRWMRRLTRMGHTVVGIHHAGKSGLQRGTSAREDDLDTVIALKQREGHRAEDGCDLTIEFEKNRSFSGAQAKSVSARLLLAGDGRAEWTVGSTTDAVADQAREFAAHGLKQSEIANELGISQPQVSKLLRKDR